MITIEESNNLVNIAVMGEFTIADFKQFEEHALHKLKAPGKINLLFDLRGMLGYTPDVAWEETQILPPRTQPRLQQDCRRHRRPMAHLASMVIPFIRRCRYSRLQQIQRCAELGSEVVFSHATS